MGFMKKLLLSPRVGWLLLAAQYILAIVIALHPHIAARLDKRVISEGKGTETTQKQAGSSGSAFYIFAFVIVLFTTAQTLEKGIAFSKNSTDIAENRFVQEYIKTITDAFDLVSNISNLSNDEIETAKSSVMKFVDSIIKLYYGERSDLEISSSLMVRKNVTDFEEDEFHSRVHFTDQKRLPSSYDCVLIVVKTSTNLANVPAQFAIPVDTDKQRILFGAPKAFCSQGIQTISDIKSDLILNELLEGQPMAVADSVRKYFKGVEFKSFASLPLITSKGKTLGVLSVHSNQLSIFGKDNRDSEKVKKLLNPTISVLLSLMR
jgi:hypothetical protein